MMEPDPPNSALHEASEFTAIARWCARLPSPGTVVQTGPGDDAAWLQWRGHLAISTDSFVEDIHFRRTWSDGTSVGRRAMAAALSDLAASRARPIACVVALSAARLDSFVDQVMDGLIQASHAWNCPLVGGDTTSSTSGLFVNITVFGEATSAGPLLRSGAQTNDLVQLSGPLGASAQAVEALLAEQDAEWPEVRPRFDLLESMASATAGIDISDGLLADAEHLSVASGRGLLLDRKPQWDRYALCGGEDYELLVTAPTPLEGFEVIGRVTEDQGLSFSDGTPLPPRPWGFVHGTGSA
jgi:thiamine-monophosphate kinase